MKFKVKFYARLRGEAIERIVDVPDEQSVKYAVKCYGSYEDDIQEITRLEE